MPRVYVYLWFDIEDYVDRESDNPPLILLNILKKHHVPVTCKIVGEKVRSLIEHGRRDVISAISECDVGYHSDTHSRHPTIWEYLADLDVISGAKEFELHEERGIKLIQEVFNRTPSCYGHPGYMWAPHVYPAMREMGIPVYLDEIGILNLDDAPYWYCGVLNLNGAGKNFSYYDGTYESPNGLDLYKAKFEKTYQRLHKGKGWGGAVSICFHPHLAINKKYWDCDNFGRGRNRSKEEYKHPPEQPAEVTKRAYQFFEEIIQYISSFEDVQWITASDAVKIFSRPKVVLGKDDLKQISQDFLSSASYVKSKDGYVSPAEVFYVVTRWLTEYANTGTFSNQTAVEEPLGPMAPAHSKGRNRIKTKDFLAAAKATSDFLDFEKRIPSRINVGGYVELSPHDYLATACRVLNQILCVERLPDKVTVIKGRPPQVDRLSAAKFKEACRWIVLPPNFDAPKIFEQACMQAWTLKPAVPKP
jgi:peptidoglycan/xylan/chitin deacetylase (PgdA/CDA1 family)